MATRRSQRLSSSVANVMPPPPAPPKPKTRKRKPLVAEMLETEDAAPTTPRKRRSACSPPPLATPSAVRLISESVVQADGGSGGHDDDMATATKPRPRAVARLVDPTATNATLLSPETARVVGSKAVDAVSPSKAPAHGTTTDNLLAVACKHLVEVDARMKALVEQNHCHVFSPEGLAEKVDPFESLVSGIISQQVSGAAAKAIKARFIALFDVETGQGDADVKHAAPATGKRFPQPSQVAAASIERLRSAGLSQRKAEYLIGLAEKFLTGEISADILADAPYEEVLERLTAVRGLGRWSVEMFACFALKRMDVFSLGDLGVQRGMAAFEGRDVAKLKSKGGKWKYMSEKEMVEISDRFKPYRSLFMWYMWRVEETDISTFE